VKKIKLLWMEYRGLLGWLLYDVIFMLVFVYIGYHSGRNAVIAEAQNTSSLNQIVITMPQGYDVKRLPGKICLVKVSGEEKGIAVDD